MNKVLLVLGSKSDSNVGKKAAGILDHFGIPYDTELASADRTPDKVDRLAESLESDLYDVCIAIAGLSAVLPAAVAARTTKPVIGVPVANEGAPLAGMDALYSIVQRPPGSPVVSVGINRGENASLFVVQMYALNDSDLRSRLVEYGRLEAEKRGYFEEFSLEK